MSTYTEWKKSYEGGLAPASGAGNSSEFVKGLRGAVPALKSSGLALAGVGTQALRALTPDAIEPQWLTQAPEKFYQKSQAVDRELQRDVSTRALVPNWEDVRFEDEGGFGRFLDYSAHAIGQNVPQLVGTLGAGAIGAKIATAGAKQVAKSAGKELGKKALSKARVKGATIGAGVGLAPQHVSESAQAQYGEMGEVNLAATAAGATINTALDLAPLGAMFKAFKFLPKHKAMLAKGMVKHPKWQVVKGALIGTAGGAAAGVATEGPTEALQEVVKQATLEVLNSDKVHFGEKDWANIIEAGAKGATVGGWLGGLGGGVSGGVTHRGLAAQQEEAERKRAEVSEEFDLTDEGFQVDKGTVIDADGNILDESGKPVDSRVQTAIEEAAQEVKAEEGAVAMAARTPRSKLQFGKDEHPKVVEVERKLALSQGLYDKFRAKIGPEENTDLLSEAENNQYESLLHWRSKARRELPQLKKEVEEENFQIWSAGHKLSDVVPGDTKQEGAGQSQINMDITDPLVEIFGVSPGISYQELVNVAKGQPQKSKKKAINDWLLENPPSETPTPFETGKGVVVNAFHGSSTGIEDNTLSEKFLGENTGAPSARLGFFSAGTKETAYSYFNTENNVIINVENNFYKNITGDIKTTQDLIDFGRVDLIKNGSFNWKIETLAGSYGLSIKKLNERSFDYFIGPDRIGNEQSYIAAFGQLERSFNDLMVNLVDEHTAQYLLDNPVGKMYEVYVKMENPYVHDYKGARYQDRANTGSYFDIISKAKKEGHDGVILLNTEDGADVDNIFISFDPNSWKHVENKGDFSINNDELYSSQVEAKNEVEAEAEGISSEVAMARTRLHLGNALGVGKLKRMEKLGILQIHEDAKEMPSGLEDAAGAWDGRVMHLAPTNFVQDESPMSVLVHESEHAGMDSMLGKSYDSFAVKFDKLEASGDVAAVAALKRAKSSAQIEDHVKSEKLAYFIEEGYERLRKGEALGKGASLWKQLVASIKAWFRSTGFGKALAQGGIEFKLEDEYVVALARRAMDYAVETESLAQEAGDFSTRKRALAMRVAHASPTSWLSEEGFPWGRPRLDYVTSGTGGTTQGWGWYSAEELKVAEDYQNLFQGEVIEILVDGETFKKQDSPAMYLNEDDSKSFRQGTPGYLVLDALKGSTPEDLKGDIQDSLTMQENNPNEASEQEQLKFLDSHSLSITQEKGKLYHLDIPDQAVGKMLLWDKPLHEQTSFVKNALESLGIDVADRQQAGVDHLNAIMEKLATKYDVPDASIAYDEMTNKESYEYDRAQLDIKQNLTGETLYEEMQDPMRDDRKKVVSEKLASVGIVGNKYLDQFSRDPRWEIPKETGLLQPKAPTHNFVIWDQAVLDQVKMLDENGKPLEVPEVEADPMASVPSSEVYAARAAEGSFVGVNAWDADIKMPRKLRLNFQDDFVEAKDMIKRVNLDREAKGKGKIPENQDIYTARDTGTTQETFARGEFKRKFYDPMAEDLRLAKDREGTSATVEDADQWVLARHAGEANQQGRERRSLGFLLKLLPKLSDVDRKAAEKEKNLAFKGVGKDKVGALHGRELRQEVLRILEAYVVKEDLSDLKDMDAINATVTNQWGIFKEKPSGMLDTSLVENGETVEVGADEVLARWEDSEKMQAVGARFDEMNRETIETNLRSGLWSKKTADILSNEYEHYVKLNREGYVEEGSKGGGLSVGRASGLREYSTLPVVHAFSNTVASAEAAEARAVRNEVTKNFARLVRANKESFEGFFEIVTDDSVNYLDKEGFVKFGPSKQRAEWDVQFWDNGKALLLKPTETNQKAMSIAKAMVKLDAPKLEGFLGAANQFNKLLRFVNVSASPIFLMSNVFRDYFTANFNLRATEAGQVQGAINKEYFRALKVLRDVDRKGKRGVTGDPSWAIVEKFEAAGGRIGWSDIYKDMDERSQKMETRMKELTPGSIHKIGADSVKFIEDYNSIFENVMRLATFNVVTKAKKDGGLGLSDQRGAKLAKDLTVNFSRRGSMTNATNALWIFSNAGIQGSAQILMNLAGKHGGKLGAAVGGTIAFSMMIDQMNRAMSDEDDDGKLYYDSIPEYVKERNMLFPSGDGKNYFRVPAPWGYNLVWRTGQLLSEALSANKDYRDLTGTKERKDFTAGGAIADFGMTALNAFNPISGGSLAQRVSPTLFDVPIMVLENKGPFGNDLAPEAFPGAVPKPNSELYWSSATMPSKWLAKLLNDWVGGGDEVSRGSVLGMRTDFNPATFDLIGSTLGGGLFRTLVGEPAKIFERMAQGKELRPNSIPLKKQFVIEPTNATNSTLYHQRVSEVLTALKQRENLQRGINRDPAKAKVLRKEKAKLLALGTTVKFSEKRLKWLRGEKRKYEQKEKWAQAEVKQKQMEKVQRRFNKAFRERALH